MIAAQTLSVSREGKSLHTFPDRALSSVHPLNQPRDAAYFSWCVMDEHRTSPRHRVLKAGTIEFSGGVLPLHRPEPVRFGGRDRGQQPALVSGPLRAGDRKRGLAQALPRDPAKPTAHRRRVREGLILKAPWFRSRLAKQRF